VVTGAGAAGSKVRGFTVQDAIGEGILVTSTSRVTIQGNVVTHDDLGAGTNATPECALQGNIPGDCGEALHLMGVADSHVIENHVVGNVGGILITDETGPSHGNVIADKVVTDNTEDCGITLPSHNGLDVGDPTKAGVYDNLITDNVSRNNGGAGVGMFAPFPGTASYDNRVIDNDLVGNGEAGVAIHAHAPGQNVSGNVIQDNDIAGNGVDPDAGSTGPNGISIFSAASPVSVTVAGNEISREQFGIFIAGPVTAQGLSSNRFSHSVTVPVGTRSSARPARGPTPSGASFGRARAELRVCPDGAAAVGPGDARLAGRGGTSRDPDIDRGAGRRSPDRARARPQAHHPGPPAPGSAGGVLPDGARRRLHRPREGTDRRPTRVRPGDRRRADRRGRTGSPGRRAHRNAGRAGISLARRAGGRGGAPDHGGAGPDGSRLIRRRGDE
jgi:nitrous oxidase accessory protein NosD